ncbi:hypothetical protein [Dictyobacter aurantiacus]|uniref:Uncharacterized protein n=1 Tax=Dictyobacter aurantiacus TaxID=1936993 RepID=A0A401ZKL1_9CHLR|nr:hypothetical protein [Dictyobacter aurantiacus]GCE07368.1 hypothetical protein KDAU_46970 [Dictyobacter aurantiacus]
MKQQQDTYPQTNGAEQRIEHWIGQLEEQTRDLLAGLALDELSQKERLGFALKMLSQIQHFLTIRQKLETPPAGSGNVQIWLQNLTRQMRGEGPDGVRIVDETESGSR